MSTLRRQKVSSLRFRMALDKYSNLDHSPLEMASYTGFDSKCPKEKGD